ncbi:MAG: hypothetical protein FWF56_05870 [Firmicutes bacterium]|nr:hypothetical protein [Bacillota bacterium]MCL1953347.1 hypothetical protein [Bacillota bacterium]
MTRVLKKLNLFVLIFFCAIFFVSCNTQATKLERMLKDIDFVNSQDGKIFLYNTKFDILTDNIDMVETIQNIDEITFESSFVMLAITKEYYFDITQEFIQNVFDLLANYNNKLLVAFLDFPDLDFLQYTIFENDKQYYPPRNFVSTFDNFENEIIKSGFGLQIGTENAEYDEQIISAFSKKLSNTTKGNK